MTAEGVAVRTLLCELAIIHYADHSRTEFEVASVNGRLVPEGLLELLEENQESSLTEPS